jgi:hypothetical protein
LSLPQHSANRLTSIRITTWNLEWFPNGSAHDATPELQAQRIAAAADDLHTQPGDVLIATHAELETRTKSGVARAATKAAEQAGRRYEPEL